MWNIQQLSVINTHSNGLELTEKLGGDFVFTASGGVTQCICAGQTTSSQTWKSKTPWHLGMERSTVLLSYHFVLSVFPLFFFILSHCCFFLNLWSCFLL